MNDKKNSSNNDPSPKTEVTAKPKDLDAKTPEIDENFPFLEDMPKEARLLLMAQMKRMGPIPHPIFEKITSDHITKIIDSSNLDSERELTDITQRRRYSMAFAIMVAAIFVFLVVYLSGSNPELLKSLIGYLIAFAGGAGIGYGVKSWRDKDK